MTKTKGVTYFDRWKDPTQSPLPSKQWYVRAWDGTHRRYLGKSFSDLQEGLTWGEETRSKFVLKLENAIPASLSELTKQYTDELRQRGRNDQYVAEIERVSRAISLAGTEDLMIIPGIDATFSKLHRTENPMGRTPIPLNINERPGTGMSYIIRNIKTGILFRCATAAHRDLRRKEFGIDSLGAYSVQEPYFTVKLGSIKTGMNALRFLCGAHHSKCLDEKGEYEWTGISLEKAKKDGLDFYDPYDRIDKINKISTDKGKQKIKSGDISTKSKRNKSNDNSVTEDRVAKHGEKTIHLSVRFLTSNISQSENSIVPKNAWTSGFVSIEGNEAHGISPKKPSAFNTLLEIPQVIEKVLIAHGIMLHISPKKSKYISKKALG